MQRPLAPALVGLALGAGAGFFGGYLTFGDRGDSSSELGGDPAGHAAAVGTSASTSEAPAATAPASAPPQTGSWRSR